MNSQQPGRDHPVPRRWIIGLAGVVACAWALAFPPPLAATLVHRPYLQNLGADHVTMCRAVFRRAAASCPTPDRTH